MKYFAYDFEIGTLYISEDDGIVVSISPDNYFGEEKESKAIQFCAQEIQAYLDGKLKEFSFKYKIKGTKFQESVWKALESIPYGLKVTYKEIAEMINNPNASQAVGNACANNTILIAIPCHRIVPKNKGSGGFRMGKNIKEHLLKHEKNHYQSR